MTGDELVRLELGDRVRVDAMCENAVTSRGDPMRWASFIRTGNADYVSTLGICAKYPIDRPRRPVRYQRYYLIDGRTRTGMMRG